MSAVALKKMLLTVAVAALAAVALAGTTVAVVTLAGGLEDSYIAGRTSIGTVSALSKDDLGMTDRGYDRPSAATPYSVFDEIE